MTGQLTGSGSEEAACGCADGTGARNSREKGIGDTHILKVSIFWRLCDHDVNANDARLAVRPSIHVDADVHDWGGETPLRVESLDEQSSLTLSTRIGRRRSSSSIRFGT